MSLKVKECVKLCSLGALHSVRAKQYLEIQILWVVSHMCYRIHDKVGRNENLITLKIYFV